MNQKAKKGHAEFRAPFGYVFVEGRLRVQEADADIVKAMFRDRASGLTIRCIAKKYDVPRSTVARILHNPIYVGMLRWKSELIQGKHQHIIESETWHVVQSFWRKGRKTRDA